MKLIAINALSALRGGGQTYIKNILEHLPDGDYKVLLILNINNRVIFEDYASEKIAIFDARWASKNIIYRVLWETFILPLKLKEWNATVYYAPGGSMINKVPNSCHRVTALRNMLPFNEQERQRFPLMSYIRFKLWLLRYIFLKSYKLSDKVIFISEYSKSIIKQYIPDIDDKSIVIPHGLNSLFLDTKVSYELPDFLKETSFYLYVSILDVYKAQKELVKTWKLLADHDFPYPLVLVGPKYNQYGEEVLTLIDELGLSGKVIYLGAVAYEQLPGLYKAARALIFASSCECCPNILLEKLAAGKPVFCSNIAPMPEFGEDAVVYFDPYDTSDLFEKVIDLEQQPEVMIEMADKAYKQALKLDWNTTTQKTINFLLNNN